MSKIKTIELKKQEVVSDIICNCCGKSLKIDESTIDNEHRIDNGEKYINFNSSVSMNVHWGFNSKKDGQYWEANVCEECVDTHLSKVIKFDKYRYGLLSGEVNYNKPIKDNE